MITLCMAELVPVFKEEQIDMEALMMLESAHLALMDIKLGPRVKILSATAKLRSGQSVQ